MLVMVSPGPVGSESSLGPAGMRASGPVIRWHTGVRDSDAQPGEADMSRRAGQSDVGPCWTVQGTGYVTGDRYPNEHLFVWEPV